MRVVCGVGEVMDTLLSQMVFRRVDLPDEGLPIMATDAHFMTTDQSSSLVLTILLMRP